MRRVAAVTMGLMLIAGSAYAWNEGGFNLLRGFLTGYEEVFAGGGAISTTGNGRFFARINQDETAIEYALKFDDLEGTVTQSHIHFGQKGTTGGISVWLCGTATNPGPAGTPTCEPGEWITGTLTADSVIGPAAQGIEPLAFNELVAAIRAGRTYVNVHSSKWPSGEIRSQIGHGDHK